jgi:hypothetical protein
VTLRTDDGQGGNIFCDGLDNHDRVFQVRLLIFLILRNIPNSYRTWNCSSMRRMEPKSGAPIAMPSLDGILG